MTTNLFTDILGASSISSKLNSAIIDHIKSTPASNHSFKQSESTALKAAFIKKKLNTQNFYKKPVTPPTAQSNKKPTKYKSTEVPQTDLQRKLESINKSTLSILDNLKSNSKKPLKSKHTLNPPKNEKHAEGLERASFKKSKYMKRTGRMLNKISASEKMKYKESSMLNNKKRKEKAKLKKFIKNKESEEIIPNIDINEDNMNGIFEDNVVETNIIKNNVKKTDFSMFSLNEKGKEGDLIENYNEDIIDESESEEEEADKPVDEKPLGWGNWYSVDEARKEYIDKRNKGTNCEINEESQPLILFLNKKNKMSSKYKPKEL